MILLINIVLMMPIVNVPISVHDRDKSKILDWIENFIVQQNPFAQSSENPDETRPAAARGDAERQHGPRPKPNKESLSLFSGICCILLEEPDAGYPAGKEETRWKNG